MCFRSTRVCRRTQFDGPTSHGTSRMLFYKWPFLIFLLVVLLGYFSLRRTRFWIFWLLAGSYFFYGWWKPYYLLLVVYSTALDYLLVALMDHCPKLESQRSLFERILHGARPPATHVTGEGPQSKINNLTSQIPLISAFRIATLLSILLFATAVIFPYLNSILGSLRPSLIALGTLVLLMAVGARLGSRRAWLAISIFNNLALLLFFKYAGFLEQNLNDVLSRSEEH